MIEVGVKINNYEIIEHIGRGGMADVWSARDQRLNRLVAIKTIAHGLSQKTDPVEMFEREARTIAAMEHPHVLPIYDFGDYKGSLFIVMRYVSGGSLDDLLVDGPMPLQQVIRMSQQIAEALDYAHTENVIHLDLKPPNILLDRSTAPYVADFGLATELDPQGRARNPGSGTLLYMAPEQLVTDIIDHRADIYSFGIMLFHMLTGQLPFNGAAPLALQQLQRQENLPDIDMLNPELPYQITDVLRWGTHKDAEARPTSLMALINELKSAANTGGFDFSGEDFYGDGLYTPPETILSSIDSELLEAIDIYSRAKHQWASGQGRFLLGISHYMLMSDYYRRADELELEFDADGRQMMLRGALEYDYEVAYWWDQVNDQERRWVCLHTIRSASAPARIRALYRLETLPDDSKNSVIPFLVGQALEIETDEQAKLAALNVLATRANIMKPEQEYAIETQYEGRLLSSMTRMGIQMLPPSLWREPVFSVELDLLIARIAMDTEFSVKVADFASRVIGRIHSLTAVRFVANEQRKGKKGALRALAIIRDEANQLPALVSNQAKFYAWVTNTVRRISDDPLKLIWRLLLVLIASWVAMGQQVYITFRSEDLFTPVRWGNTIAIGLVFGLFVSFVVLFADELSTRLRGFWTWWIRLGINGLIGFFVAMLTWSAYTWFYLNQVPEWELMRLGGFGLVFGFLSVSLLNLKPWQAILISFFATYIPIFAAFYHFCQQAFICSLPDGQPFPSLSFLPIGLLGLFSGILLAAWFKRPTYLPQLPIPHVTTVNILSVMLSSLIWAGTILITYVLAASQPSLNWDSMTLIFVLSSLMAFVMAYLWRGWSRWLFAALSLALFALIVLIRFPLGTVLPVPDSFASLLYYDQADMIFTVAIPFALIIAIGAYGPDLVASYRRYIGVISIRIERPTWGTGVLFFTMFSALIIATLAMFSAHYSILWALFWSVWGAFTFAFALAAWQWHRWGIKGLILSGITLIMGAIVLDLNTYNRIIEKSLLVNKPLTNLFDSLSIILLSIQIIALLFLIWGVYRAKLWAGIGLIGLAIFWFVAALFFNQFQESMTFIALVSFLFVLFGIAPIDEILSRSEGRSFLSDQPAAPVRHVADTLAFDDAPGLTLETQLLSDDGEVDAREDTSPIQTPTLKIDTSHLPASHRDTELIHTDQASPDSLTTGILDDLGSIPKIRIDTAKLKDSRTVHPDVMNTEELPTNQDPLPDDEDESDA